MSDDESINKYLKLKQLLLEKTISNSESELHVLSSNILNYFTSIASDICKFSMELDYEEDGEMKTRKLTFIITEEQL